MLKWNFSRCLITTTPNIQIILVLLWPGKNKALNSEFMIKLLDDNVFKVLFMLLKWMKKGLSIFFVEEAPRLDFLYTSTIQDFYMLK